ncbi:Calcium influx-promoting protein ehs1 [Ceratocystis lukuohia]|uniref:Calcium influx-promoting protein ehs1 n=1 Tax=Ceratocystis lukuohia TaxID=2019550 RepID=A0ABR4MHI2_9PEZI
MLLGSLPSRLALGILALSFAPVSALTSGTSPPIDQSLPGLSANPADSLRLAARIASPPLDIDGQPNPSIVKRYESEFALDGLLDRSIVGRAEPVATVIPNNVPQRLTLDVNETVIMMFELSASNPTSTLSASASATATGSLSSSAAAAESASADLAKRGEDGLDLGEEEEDYDKHWSPEGLLKRATETVYISANTCLQPTGNNDNVTAPPPQLTMYISTSPENTSPGPNSTNNTQVINFTQGALMYNTTTSSSLYFSIVTPSNLTNHTGSWQFEIAVSTDGFYHRYVASEQRLFWVDSDAEAAVLTTGNLTMNSNASLVNEIMEGTPPYVLFADTAANLEGLRYSYCGLQTYAAFASERNDEATDDNVAVTMTQRSGGHPKQQFYIGNLEAKTTYYGIAVQVAEIPGNATQQYGKVKVSRDVAGTSGRIGGGGVVYARTPFETKEGTTCRIITGLEFCSDTEYAVPSNIDKYSMTELASLYDDYAAEKYEIFEKALAQSACEANPAGRYSLVRTCDDCRKAYKQWLCSVVIPRCEDYDSANLDSHIRNANTPFPNGTSLPESVIDGLSQHPLGPAFMSARNADINDVIEPGPYREILPCDDLCYDIVQSCPSALEFGCPLRGSTQYESSYAQKNNSKALACNFPGALHQASPAPGRLAVGTGALAMAMVLAVGAMLAV